MIVNDRYRLERLRSANTVDPEAMAREPAPEIRNAKIKNLRERVGVGKPTRRKRLNRRAAIIAELHCEEGNHASARKFVTDAAPMRAISAPIKRASQKSALKSVTSWMVCPSASGHPPVIR